MTQSLPHIMIGYCGFVHLCMHFVVHNIHRIIQTNKFFYSLANVYCINIVATDVACTAVTASISDINLLHSRH